MPHGLIILLSEMYDNADSYKYSVQYVATRLGITARTVRRYFQLLQHFEVIHEVEPALTRFGSTQRNWMASHKAIEAFTETFDPKAYAAVMYQLGLYKAMGKDLKSGGQSNAESGWQSVEQPDSDGQSGGQKARKLRNQTTVLSTSNSTVLESNKSNDLPVLEGSTVPEDRAVLASPPKEDVEVHQEQLFVPCSSERLKVPVPAQLVAKYGYSYQLVDWVIFNWTDPPHLSRPRFKWLKRPEVGIRSVLFGCQVDLFNTEYREAMVIVAEVNDAIIERIQHTARILWQNKWVLWVLDVNTQLAAPLVPESKLKRIENRDDK